MPLGKEVKPSWSDTLKKAWQSIRALGDRPVTVTSTQFDANGEPKPVPVRRPHPASNLWRFVALREPQHTIESL